MKRSQLKQLIREEIQSVFSKNEELEEGVLKNVALAALLGILPATAVKGQTIDKEKIVNIQQQDQEDPYYPWIAKSEQKQRQQRAIALYGPLKNKVDKVKVSSSMAQQNKKWLENLTNGTLISSPTDDDLPEFHLRNPAPLDAGLKEIQDVIINLPEDKIQKLLDIDFRRATPKMVYDISRITGISVIDIIKYANKIKGLTEKGFTA
jgi:hypothetical protein